MLLHFIVANLAIAQTSLARPHSEWRKHKVPACHDLTIPITVTSNNIELPHSVDPKDPLSFLSGFDPSTASTISINGNYNISARYCEPEIRIANRANTLQILGHGNTYDKTYWSGLGFPGYHGDDYSWMAYASKKGYPTLTIDRLGNGHSSHPDPIAEVQLSMHIEILHQIVSLARSDKLLDRQPRRFDNYVYAGHSYGSFVGNGLSQRYPLDIDAYILTGFTNQPLQLAAPGIMATARYLPAALVNPSRFSGLALGYLAGSSKPGREAVFYTDPGVDYDKNIFELDWATAGTLTVGEAATESFTTAPNYTGAVFVLNGRNDTIFCGLGTGDGDCGEGGTSKSAKTRELYPNARNYGYFNLEDVGHDWNFHFTAPVGFQRAHDWLLSVGL